LGVYDDGTVDIKGLTGKKRHTPPILKKAFTGFVNILADLKTEDEITDAKENIKILISKTYEKIKKRDFTVEDVAFSMQLGKPLNQYDTNPQHVKAARMLEAVGVDVGTGYIVSFVATKKGGVKPLQMAKLRDVDIGKYHEHMESMFSQVLDALGLSFDEVAGKPVQQSLSSFFG